MILSGDAKVTSKLTSKEDNSTASSRPFDDPIPDMPEMVATGVTDMYKNYYKYGSSKTP